MSSESSPESAQYGPDGLPVSRRLTLAYASSLLIALLIAVASLAGLAYGEAIYPSQAMLQQKLPTDLFTLINLAEILPALTSPAPEHLLTYPVWISDLIVLAPAWLIGGWLLWRRRSLGYVAGAGLLLVGSLLFLGAIFALIFPALTAAAPVDLMAVLLMLVTGLICFLPFALFARGILRSGTETGQP